MRGQDSDRTKRSASGTSRHFAALRTCDAGIKFGGTQFPRDDGGKQARSPGSAKETVKTIARGMPGVSGVTVVTNARVYYTTRAAAGASGARHSLRPLLRAGRAGQNSRENARRDREVAPTSFRGDVEHRITMCSCTSENPRIPRCAIAHPRSGANTPSRNDDCSGFLKCGQSPCQGSGMLSATSLGNPCPLLVLDVSRNRCFA
jgi:hypothetical protein